MKSHWRTADTTDDDHRSLSAGSTGAASMSTAPLRVRHRSTVRGIFTESVAESMDQSLAIDASDRIASTISVDSPGDSAEMLARRDSCGFATAGRRHCTSASAGTRLDDGLDDRLSR